MLTDYPLDPILAAKDIGRAKQWYADKLGWHPAYEVEGPGVAVYKVEGATITLYQTQNAGSAKNTVAIWTVSDIRPEMERLRDQGVTFEDYDFGDFKTVDGIMTDPRDGSMNAWFADGDGNIWSLFSTPTDPPPNGITPMLAAADLERAKAWYADRLGLAAERDYEGQLAIFRSGGKRFSVYVTQYAGTAQNTVAGWNVKDLRAEMAALRARGVTFEEYDFGAFKTVDGVMDDGQGNLTAWLTDSEGNILGLEQEGRGA